jgi:hypothetical protein
MNEVNTIGWLGVPSATTVPSTSNRPLVEDLTFTTTPGCNVNVTPEATVTKELRIYGTFGVQVLFWFIVPLTLTPLTPFPVTVFPLNATPLDEASKLKAVAFPVIVFPVIAG